MGKLVSWVHTHRKAVFGYLTFAFGLLSAAAQHYHWNLPWLWLVGMALSSVGVHAVRNARSDGQP